MGWSYDPLWKLLIDRKMTREQLRITVGASSSTMAKMARGENVAMDVLDRICNALHCKIGEILEHVHDDLN